MAQIERLRSYPWLVVLVAALLQAASSIPFEASARELQALAGALGLLVAVLAALAAGWRAGVCAAFIGWAFVFFSPADEASEVALSLPAWMLAAGVAGFVADRLRRRQREVARIAGTLAALVDSSSDAVVEASVDGRIRHWSRRAELLYGYAAVEVEGRPLSMLAPAGRAEIDRILAGVADGARIEAEDVHSRRDGAELAVSLAAVPLRGGEGEILGCLVLLRDMGERRRIEEELLEAGSRYQALVEHLPLVTYAHPFGDRSAMTEMNLQAEWLLGYSTEEWRAEPELFARLLHPDDRERVLGKLAAAGKCAEPFRCEYRMFSRSGRVVWVRDVGAVVRDERGRPGYVRGFLLDLSATKWLEQENEAALARAAAARVEAEAAQAALALALRAGEALSSSLDEGVALRRLAELAVRNLAAHCVVDVLDEDGTLQRLVVAHADSATRQAAQAFADSPRIEAQVLHVVRSGKPAVVHAEPSSGEDEARAAVGTECASAIYMPLVVGGRPIGAISFIAEGPDQVYGADELALAENVARQAAIVLDAARLRRRIEERADAARVLTYVGDGVILLDRAGVIRLWNPAAGAVTGCAANSVVGRRVAEALPGWERIADRIPIASSPEPAEAATVPLETERGERWIAISGVDFFGGKVYAFRDVTAAHALEELRAEFVATASHELRTPLAAVYGAAQTLRRHDFALDEGGRERFVSLIVDEAERMSRIVNEILLASQLDAGRLDIAGESFDPSELAARAVEAQRSVLPEGFTLELEVPRRVPAIAADRDKLRQILVNLIENAVKYSPEGGRIVVELEPLDEIVCFHVRDEGLGVAFEEQERIFEKFFRIDPDHARGIRGAGLGLYICRELVQRMNGRIWVESTGEGSVFSFELPVAEQPVKAPITAAHSEGG